MKNLCLRSILIIVTASLMLTSCTSKQVDSQAEQNNTRLALIIKNYTESRKKLDAFDAPYFGIEDNLEHFGDYLSDAYILRIKQLVTNTSTELENVDATLLRGDSQTTYQLFKSQIDLDRKSIELPEHKLSFNQLGNRMARFIEMADPKLSSYPFDTPIHYRKFAQRMDEFPQYVVNQIAILRQGIASDITLNCDIARLTRKTYKQGLTVPIEKNPFWKPILSAPKSFTAEQIAELKQQYRHSIKTQILPSFKNFDKFFVQEYTPHCRKSFGLGQLPNGTAWYQLDIERYTNLKISPEELHKIGQQEVARIQNEMQKEFLKIGYKGTFVENLRILGKDKSMQFSSAQQIFTKFAEVKSLLQNAIKPYFNELPQSDYSIVESANPEAPAGSYMAPTEMQPKARFFANTKNLHSVNRYDILALSAHETVPGHHLQLGLQFEKRQQLSEYRRKLYYSSAFIEGWAHYAEVLADEIGVYANPVDRIGYWNYQMLRAVRLVVDTGIHSQNWSQQQAIDYMRTHLAGDPKGIEIEVNRYSVIPGQALAYKVGQLKILELRERAKTRLGSRFKLSDFHQAVIGNGTVSLPILEEQINNWIELRAKSSAN